MPSEVPQRRQRRPRTLGDLTDRNSTLCPTASAAERGQLGDARGVPLRILQTLQQPRLAARQLMSAASLGRRLRPRGAHGRAQHERARACAREHDGRAALDYPIVEFRYRVSRRLRAANNMGDYPIPPMLSRVTLSGQSRSSRKLATNLKAWKRRVSMVGEAHHNLATVS